MTPLELLFEIRDRYNLSTRDMARLLGVRDTTVDKWVTLRLDVPADVYAELVDIEQEIMWLASYLKANPTLQGFNETFFKAAINKIDVDETI